MSCICTHSLYFPHSLFLAFFFSFFLFLRLCGFVTLCFHLFLLCIHKTHNHNVSKKIHLRTSTCVRQAAVLWQALAAVICFMSLFHAIVAYTFPFSTSYISAYMSARFSFPPRTRTHTCSLLICRKGRR